jgi:Domain of unknown function DUF11
MRMKTFGRVLGALCLAGSFAFTAAGSASASPPRWVMTVKNLPPVVAEGNAMGYQVTITNQGPSNISQLFLVTQTQDSPAFVGTPSQGSCAPAGSGPLACTFGALNAKKSVTVVVAYAGPVSGTYDPGDPVFEGNTTGLTFTDAGSSHGDTLFDPNEKATMISVGNGNFAGGFSLDGGQINTDPNLGDSNKQATSVAPPASDLVVTVEDGPSVSFACKTVCSKAFGEWSAINVGNGQKFDTFFPITLLVRASDAPNNLSQIKLAHVLDNGTVVVLNQCTTTLQNCIEVTPVGTNVQIKAWVNTNGGAKGIR